MTSETSAAAPAATGTKATHLQMRDRLPNDLLNTEQLADALHISKRTPEHWRMTGEGPPFTRAGGRRVLYRWCDVAEWLAARTVKSTAQEAA